MKKLLFSFLLDENVLVTFKLSLATGPILSVAFVISIIDICHQDHCLLPNMVPIAIATDIQNAILTISPVADLNLNVASSILFQKNDNKT
jgi:hypothetical protein